MTWTRCVGISSLLLGTGLETPFHDLDRADNLALAVHKLLGSYSSVLAIGTRKGAHLASFDLVDHAQAQASKIALADLGQDPKHTEAHATYGRSILRVSAKYGAPDLRAVLFMRERRHARPWSGPHWDFYRSLLGLPEYPRPGPDALRVEGDGSVILEIYYTPRQAPA